MRELKRVILSKTSIITLAVLLLFNTFMFLRQESPGTEKYTAKEFKANYSTIITVCQEMRPEDAITYLDNLRIRAEAVIFLPKWVNAEDKTYKEKFRSYYLNKYGGELIAGIESGEIDYSEDAVNKAYLTEDICNLVIKQLNYLNEYPAYLQNIKENADKLTSVSIFSDPDSFSYRNIMKTVDDFTDIDVSGVILDNDLTLNSMFADNLADYSILIYIIVIVLLLISERKRGLWSLIYTSADGRAILAVKRIIILLICSATGVVVLLGGKLIISSFLYGGLGDISRPVQSAELFKSVSDMITVKDFLIRYFVFKIFGTWAAGLLVWFLMLFISNTAMASAVTAVALGIEYMLFSVIPDSFSIVLFRFINIFALIDYKRIYMRYLNINFFNIPVSGNQISTSVLLISPVLLGICCFMLQRMKKPYSSPHKLIRLYEKILRTYDRISDKFGLFAMEMKKILWYQKGVAVLAVMIIWALYFSAVPPVDWNNYDSTTAYYKSVLEGPVTEETLDLIDEEISSLTGNVEDYNSASAAQYQALSVLRVEVEEKLRISANSGSPFWILDSTIYDALMNDNINDYQRETAMIAMLFTLLLLAGIFSYENQQKVKKLLHSSDRGDINVWSYKVICALILTFLVWFIICGTEIIKAISLYGAFHALEAPVQSLTTMELFPLRITIGRWLTIMYFIRLIVLNIFAVVVMLISQLCSKVSSSIIINIVILIIPGALVLLGIKTMDYYSFTILFSVTQNLNSAGYIYIIMAFIGIFLCSICKILWRKIN